MLIHVVLHYPPLCSKYSSMYQVPRGGAWFQEENFWVSCVELLLMRTHVHYIERKEHVGKITLGGGVTEDAGTHFTYITLSLLVQKFKY